MSGSVLAVVTGTEEVAPIVSLAATFAEAYRLQLQVMCWAAGPEIAVAPPDDNVQSPAADALVDATRRFVDASTTTDPLPAKNVNIFRTIDPDRIDAVLAWSKQHDPRLMIVADASSREATTNIAANKLLLNSPSTTFLLFRPHTIDEKTLDIFLLASDSQHDATSLALAAKLVEQGRARLTVARVEQEIPEATAVGMRDLRQLMRDSGVKKKDNIRLRVLKNTTQLFQMAEDHDLVLVPAGTQESTEELLQGTRSPTIGLVKQRPPLRRWRRRRHERWGLSPADYADLIQGLRRGSRASLDYFVMVAAATAIATLGLLQDSPAVVIGAMLVAPLMTPIIGCGLGLAQANSKIFRSAAYSIFCGFVVTLAVSFALAWLLPGKEVTAQVLARGDPNLLDLLIALSSSIAAAYALARPSLVGAIAGVAIATALVPPLASIGIALAYQDFVTAHGATRLFLTNMVAIILGAAGTFRLLGVTSSHTEALAQRWVYRIIALLGIGTLLLLYPLSRSLERTIELGKPQPRTFRLSEHVEDAIHAFVAQRKGVSVITTGRPASPHDKADVLIVLATNKPLPRSYGDKLVELVRKQLADPDAVINVSCVREAWLDSEETQTK